MKEFDLKNYLYNNPLLEAEKDVTDSITYILFYYLSDFTTCFLVKYVIVLPI